MKLEQILKRHHQPIIAALALVAIAVALTLLSDHFLSLNNIFNIGKQASINLIVALGMTIVIISAGIDLSVGSLLGLTISVVAVLSVVQGMNILAASVIGVLVAVMGGTINGLIIQYGRVPAFIATLGTMGVARGVVLLISRGNPSMSFPEEFLWLADGKVLGVPMPILFSAAMVLATWFLLDRTRLGREIFALGGNEEAARLSGIAIARVRVATYALSGLCCGIGGLIFAARVGAAPPSAGTGYELNAIAAVIIGGTSLAGGRGNVLGTVVGALLMALISNGLNILEVDPYWQGIVIGAIIVVAVMLANLQRRV